MRILDKGFAARASGLGLYPADPAGAIDALNAAIHASLKNGVCRAGFAVTRETDGKAVAEVIATLDLFEARLADGRTPDRACTGARLPARVHA